MRVCLFRSGVLAAMGLLSTSLVSADDNFSAGRKMEGASRYSSSGTLDAARQSQGVTSPFSPSTLRSYSQQENTPPSVMKRTDNSGSNVQEIFPTANLAQPDTAVTSSPNTTNAAVPAVGGGLKSLQQRFSALRRQSNNKSMATSEAPPAKNQPAPPVETPSAMPARAATMDATAGPNAGGPVPPTMPDIRTAQRPTAAPLTNAMRGGALNAPSTGLAGTADDSSAAGSAAPTPATSSRRMPTGQASSLPREDQPTPAIAGDANMEPEHAGTTSVMTNSFTAPARSDLALPLHAAPPVHAVAPSRGNNVLFTRQSPVLGVETVGPRSITIGKEATYTVAVSNTGDAAAQDVKVSVRIPPWTEVVGATATSGSAQAAADTATEPLTWNVPRLEAGGKEQLSLRLVPRESRPFDLAVQWTFSPVVSQAMVEVKEPKLAMSVAGPEEILYGDTKVYKLSLANPGTGDAENVVLFLAPVDGSAGTPTRHEIGNIAAGQNKLVEVELTARHAGKLAIRGSAIADGNLKTETTQEVLVRRAGLKVITEGPELKFAGTVADFHVVVNNPGNASAENVQVSAMLPAGAKYVSSTGGQYVADQHKVVWTVPSLRSGGEQDFEVKCMLNTPGANRLQVVALAASDLSDTSAINTNVEALADLKLEVSDPTGPVPVGEEVAYELHIRNRGTKAADNVAVAGFFSGGIEPQSAHGAQYEIAPGQIVFKPLVSIAPGAEVVLKVKAKAQQAGNHVFRAEVNCASVGMKLASEETTLFYGEGGSRPARMATKPNVPLGGSAIPSQSGAGTGGSIIR